MAITQTSKNTAKGRFFLGCFFSVFMLFGLAMSVVFLWPLVRIAQASNWRETPCTILSSKVESHSSTKGGETYSIEVAFEYFVDDQRHVGTHYKFAVGSSSGYDGKKEVVNRLPPGTRTVCYVNRRDPDDAVIERGFTADILFGLIPLVFAAIGAGGLIVVFVLKRKPPRPGSAPGMPATGKQGTTPVRGPLALKASTTPALRFGCLFGFALLWNGIMSVFVVQTYSGWKGGHGDGCATVFMIPFVLVGLLLVGLSVHGCLALFNPRPTLKLNPSTIALGDLVEVEWETIGNVDRVREFSITLEGREEATYKRGTSNSTDKSTFAILPLAQSTRGKDLRRGKAKFTVPADSMHSFKSSHNRFVWVIQVKGDIPRWPDISEEFPIEVLPQRSVPGGPA
jgi:hypothetical protein